MAAQGEVITIPAVLAAILARKRLISLERLPAISVSNRRTYLRRDLVPEEP